MNYNELINSLGDNHLLKNYSTLRINEVLTESDLSRGKYNLNNIPISECEIWLGCECPNRDIKIGTTFDLLMPYHNIENYNTVNAKLVYICMGIRQIGSSDVLPRGYYAACLIGFDGGIPNELLNVRKSGEQYDSDKHEIYFLLQNEQKKLFKSYLK